MTKPREEITEIQLCLVSVIFMVIFLKSGLHTKACLYSLSCMHCHCKETFRDGM